MKKILLIIAVILLTAITLSLGYLMMVFTTWGIMTLVNKIFETSYNFNIWFLGLLIYIVWLIFFSNNK